MECVSSKIIVGVVSDTHLPRFGRQLPVGLVEGLKSASVRRIFHCGDHTTMLAIELLRQIAPTDAVLGNNDAPELAEEFDVRKIVVIGGVTVGLVHGDRGRGRTTPLRALSAFSEERVDVVCFGHSHQPYLARHGDVLLLNPGSPTDRRREPAFSYALLTLGDGAPRAEIKRF
jgi:uncharacterized protein